jgi:dTDP-4-amino-4,6-dideoxygalactose transaminase
MKKSEKIYVTQPHLPPLEEYIPYLEKIWAAKNLTNGGPMHQELEKRLADYLDVPHIALCANGTVALEIALGVLNLQGEVITSPFTFVATAHAIRRAGLTPVFADIDPNTGNLDPIDVERKIGPSTVAILPVHCYGHSCDVAGFKTLADRHNLKLIYDAAHAFGVRRGTAGLLSYGDFATLSFHATKVFNTFEGGAIICQSAEMKARVDEFKNFGILSSGDIEATGTNGKMSEVNAAFGLLQLDHIDAAIRARKIAERQYRQQLTNVKGIRFLATEFSESGNSAYMPIVVEKQFSLSRDELFLKLQEENIYTRRYFYPLVSNMTAYSTEKLSNDLANANELAESVLCLPIYADLSNENIQMICSTIRDLGGRHESE